MKPVILFVDDEPHNLTVFEAALPDEWDVKTFDNPLNALDALERLAPWIILSDQRMPGLSGVRFLELAKKLHPNAIRIIVTGYSEEDLVVESVRKAQIFDYIRKPWEPDDLEASIRRAVAFYEANEQARALLERLRLREEELSRQNTQLEAASRDLAQAVQRERAARLELEAWAPPFILDTLGNESITFPISRDIIGITFDIIGSSNLHEQKVDGRSLRSTVLKKFTEILLAHGGWRESHSGDSAYGHFGLWRAIEQPAEAALATASEFRVALRSLQQTKNAAIECGVALHVAKGSLVDVHTVNVSMGSRQVSQKSFDTSSVDIDVLHRMEKLTHSLPGSNIIMSEEFFRLLKQPSPKIRPLGKCLLKGQKAATMLYLLPSDRTTEEHIAELCVSSGIDVSAEKKVA